MHSELRDRIQAMRARLDGCTPVAEIRASSQLFVTPAPVCHQMTDLAGISNSDRILEPEAGTGAILRAIREVAPLARCDAVELNAALAAHLRAAFPGVNVLRCFNRPAQNSELTGAVNRAGEEAPSGCSRKGRAPAALKGAALRAASLHPRLFMVSVVGLSVG